MFQLPLKLPKSGTNSLFTGYAKFYQFFTQIQRMKTVFQFSLQTQEIHFRKKSVATQTSTFHSVNVLQLAKKLLKLIILVLSHFGQKRASGICFAIVESFLALNLLKRGKAHTSKILMLGRSSTRAATNPMHTFAI